MFKFLLVASQIALATLASANFLWAGVNEAGGEFAAGTLPGRFGVDYEFINKSNVAYFVNNGVNFFRVTFLMERMCPVNPKTGLGLGSHFNETYFNYYAEAINYITELGATALIDPHNYMRYNDPSSQPMSGSVIGNYTDPRAASTTDFYHFWNELASRFKNNQRVIFGINNEPHDMPTELVFVNDQAAIKGIRDAGAHQLILVPGNSWTGSESWLDSSNGETPNGNIMQYIQDPLNNFAFDMHLYLDSDHSGTHDACVSASFGVDGITDAGTWLSQNNFKAVLSETGAGANALCYESLKNLLGYVHDHPQFLGWSYWSAGPIWWGGYFLSIEPFQGQEFNTTWKEVLQPLIKSYRLRY